MKTKELDIPQKRLLHIISKGTYADMSLSEIADSIGVDYPQAVLNKLVQLENRWLVRRGNDGQFYSTEEPIDDVVSFPFLRTAQCWPDWKIVLDDVSDRIMISTKILPIQGKKEEYWFVKARWDSMEPLIHEDDLLFIHFQWFCDNGEVALVSHLGEQKIKKVYCLEKKVILVSFNSNYKDQEISVENDVKILGVVKKIITNP